MADQLQLLEAVLQAGGPVRLGEIAKRVNSEAANIRTQIKRFVKHHQLAATGEKDLDYSLTDAGRQKLEELRREKGRIGPTEPLVGTAPKPTETPPTPPPTTETPAAGGPAVAEPLPSEEVAGTTEYPQFISICEIVGLDPKVAQLVARHTWLGGKWNDLDWVWKALMQMQVRPDLAQRIWHSWRSQLQQAIPTDLQELLGSGKPVTAKAATSAAGEGEAAASAGLPLKVMSHIIRDNTPVYVGEGLGDMDYKDATRLCEVRAAAAARSAPAASTAQTPGSMAEDLVKVVNAVRGIGGEAAPGTSYLIEQTPEGAKVSEIEPGAPVVVERAQPPQPAEGKSWLINQQGEVVALEAGKPTVIMQAPPTAPAVEKSKSYVWDRSTGEVKEVAPGEPIILGGLGTQQSQTPVIQFNDPSGKPFTLDLSTYFKLEEHKAKIARDEESHEVKMEIAKGVKDIITKAGRAFARMED